MGIGRGRDWVLALASATALVPATARAQAPGQGRARPLPPRTRVTVVGPSACEPRGPGPIRGAVRHVAFTLHDRFIGYPGQFARPPVGAYNAEIFATMRAGAAAHQFTLYRSDFMDGSAALSPIGAQRLSLMTARLGCWPGPMVVEWTPDRPGLAESRRDAVVALMTGARQPIEPGRIVVGPSPYFGLIGDDIAVTPYPNFGIYENMIFRDTTAGRSFQLTPNPSASSLSGNR
ncbi:MAG TPA: hypothetical protein VG406_22340 [Isosphaeraceae bacterium]|jgi:hypothetical protein|nr:hypothetical protein [Isosphaeraceae bacterium]